MIKENNKFDLDKDIYEKISNLSKIRIFISSDSNEKSNDFLTARKNTKELLLCTGLVDDVFLYEDKGASTSPNVKLYLDQLKRCNVIVFIIDLSSEIPEGVKKEIKASEDEHIRPLYIFTKEKETPQENSATQKKRSIINKGNIKFASIDNLNEAPIMITRSVVEDVLDYYLGSGTSHDDIHHLPLLSGNITYKDNHLYQDISKDYIENIPSDSISFMYDLLNRNLYVPCNDNMAGNKTSFTEFIRALLFLRNMDTDLLENIRTELSIKNENKLLNLRYDAMSSYFLGDIEKAISYLRSALAIAKDDESVPFWFRADIAIDLRNLIEKKFNLSGKFPLENEAQDYLSAQKDPVCYPIIDRLKNEIYADLSKYYFNSVYKSIHSMSFTNHDRTIKKLLEVPIVAIYNGSITQLLLFPDIYIGFFRLLDSERYLPQYVKEVIRISSLSSIDKKTSQILFEKSRVNTDIISSDSVMAMLSCCDYQFYDVLKIRSRFLILSLLSQSLSEEDFSDVWKIAKKDIYSWLNQDTHLDGMPDLISGFLTNSIFRLDTYELTQIIKDILEKPDINRYRAFNNVLINVLYWVSSESDILDDSNLKRTEDLITSIIIDELKAQEPSGIPGLDKLALTYLDKCKVNENRRSIIKEKATEIFPELYDKTISKIPDLESFNHKLEKILLAIELEKNSISSGKSSMYSTSYGSDFAYLDRLCDKNIGYISDLTIKEIFDLIEKILYDKNIYIEYKYNALISIWCLSKDDNIKKIIKDNYIHSIINNKDKIFECPVFTHTYLKIDVFTMMVNYQLFLKLFSGYDPELPPLDIALNISLNRSQEVIFNIVTMFYDYLTLIDEDKLNSFEIRNSFGYLLSLANHNESRIREAAIACLTECVKVNEYFVILKDILLGLFSDNTFETKQTLLCGLDDILSESQDDYVKYIFDLADIDNNHRLRQISRLRRRIRFGDENGDVL